MRIQVVKNKANDRVVLTAGMLVLLLLTLAIFGLSLRWQINKRDNQTLRQAVDYCMNSITVDNQYDYESYRFDGTYVKPGKGFYKALKNCVFFLGYKDYIMLTSGRDDLSCLISTEPQNNAIYSLGFGNIRYLICDCPVNKFYSDSNSELWIRVAVKKSPLSLYMRDMAWFCVIWIIPFIIMVVYHYYFEKKSWLKLQRAHRYSAYTYHEIMNPVNAVKLKIEYLLKYRNGNYSKNDLQNILQQVNVIQTNTEAIYALSLGKKEQKCVYSEPVDLCFVTEKLTAEAAVPEKHNFKLNAKSPHVVLTSQKFLVVLLRNLINNALKYSKSDSAIVIDIFCEGEKTVYRIKNEGCISSRNQVKHMFDFGYRGINEENKTGYGVGLTLSKEIAEALNIDFLFRYEKGNYIFELCFNE